MLEVFCLVSEGEDDKLCWENLACQYRLNLTMLCCKNQSHLSYSVVEVIKRQMDFSVDQVTIFELKRWKKFVELVFCGKKF